ncbi:hypothetical protein LUZ63_014359 [Rhynchospora breviuscula]|uniref:Cytochrome P450 n=1 Tax=Rhynchospora breviuscula TaxID=2022672 RepID=A0A9Q0CA88_9POAL|nr:hypothetical protein LUZ63_014359 [Rhynchospora breviuscula]
MEALHLVAIFLLSSLFLKLVFLTSKQKHTAKLPPSPPSLPIIGHLHLVKKPLHRSLSLLSAQYGPILYLRFGHRPVLVISSPQLVEECFTTNDVALANRPNFPSVKELTNNYSNLTFSNYGPSWRHLRKTVTVQILSNHRLLLSTSARNDEARYLAHRLFVGSADDKSTFNKVNVKVIAFEFVLNVVMGMIAGKRYYGEEAKDWEEARRFRQMTGEMFALAPGSRLMDFFPWLRLVDSISSLRQLKSVVKKRTEFSQRLIDEIRKGIDAQKKKTMIGDLLGLQEREPGEYNDDLIRTLSLSILQAGTETSSNTIEWAMSLLLNNPHVLAKAQHEIDTVVGRDRLLEESDVPSLPYLRAIINETLRLHPAAPLNLPHESAADSIIGGYKIPKGTTIFINIHAIHKDPSIWKDPTEFKPERFENGKVEGLWLLPFGMGRRKCPGEGLAIKMIALALGTWIQCFEWERIGANEVDMTEGSSGFTVGKAVRLDAMYRPRPEMVPLLVGL